MKTYTFPEIPPDFCWNSLAFQIAGEPGMMSRTTGENLKNLYQQGLSVLLFDGASPVGHIAAWPVGDGYLEIGSVWICDAHRGQRLSLYLYHAIKEAPAVQVMTAFGITKNPIALKAGKHACLELIYDWNAPVPWGKTCGPCELKEDSEKAGCSERNVNCWLRVMQR